VLVPIVHGGREGLLVIRRSIDPGKGKLALTGGFLEEQETSGDLAGWRRARGARGVRRRRRPGDGDALLVHLHRAASESGAPVLDRSAGRLGADRAL